MTDIEQFREKIAVAIAGNLQINRLPISDEGAKDAGEAVAKLTNAIVVGLYPPEPERPAD